MRCTTIIAILLNTHCLMAWGQASQPVAHHPLTVGLPLDKQHPLQELGWDTQAVRAADPSELGQQVLRWVKNGIEIPKIDNQNAKRMSFGDLLSEVARMNPSGALKDWAPPAWWDRLARAEPLLTDVLQHLVLDKKLRISGSKSWRFLDASDPEDGFYIHSIPPPGKTTTQSCESSAPIVEGVSAFYLRSDPSVRPRSALEALARMRFVERNPLNAERPAGRNRIERPVFDAQVSGWYRFPSGLDQILRMDYTVKRDWKLARKYSFTLVSHESYSPDWRSCVTDYRGSTLSGAFHVLVGRDNWIVVVDSTDNVVAVLFVTRLMYRDGEGNKPEQVVREAHWGILHGCER